MSLKMKLLIALILAVTILVFIGGIFYFKNFVVSNVDTHGKETFLFIPRGATQETVVEQIIQAGFIKNESTFKWMVKKKNYRGRNIVPGKYKITNGWSNNALINHLRAGNGRIDVYVRFNQVRTLKDLSVRLTKEIPLDSNEVYNWLLNPDSVKQFGFNENNIICMFIPNTYFVDWDITTPELMRKMYKEYIKFWNTERLEKAKQCGLSPAEVSTLASIVYWETKVPEDMPVVAGVYMNRLRIGMALQADPTIIFALNDYTIRRVLKGHKEVDSPYNTYKYPGLPPGPILIPPISYIDAVLNYSKHNYLYFVAKEDLSGYSYFSTNYNQHMIYAEKYHKALNEQKILK